MYELLDKSLEQAIEVWDCDRNTEVTTNRLVTTMKNFNQIIHFVSSQQLLSPILPLITCLQISVFWISEIWEMIYPTKNSVKILMSIFHHYALL